MSGAWGVLARPLRKPLVGMGHEVLGIDHDEEVVQEMADKLTHVVVSEAIDETVVKSLGLRNFDAAIIAIGDLEPSLLCCMILKEAGMATILAKASSEIHGKMLKKSAPRPSSSRNGTWGGGLVTVWALPTSSTLWNCPTTFALLNWMPLLKLAGKSLVDLDVRRRFGVNVVAVKHPDKKTEISMDPQKPLIARDILVLIGTQKDIEKLREEL